jgi:hypothetical protein
MRPMRGYGAGSMRMGVRPARPVVMPAQGQGQGQAAKLAAQQRRQRVAAAVAVAQRRPR